MGASTDSLVWRMGRPSSPMPPPIAMRCACPRESSTARVSDDHHDRSTTELPHQAGETRGERGQGGEGKGEGLTGNG